MTLLASPNFSIIPPSSLFCLDCRPQRSRTKPTTQKSSLADLFLSLLSSVLALFLSVFLRFWVAPKLRPGQPGLARPAGPTLAAYLACSCSLFELTDSCGGGATREWSSNRDRLVQASSLHSGWPVAAMIGQQTPWGTTAMGVSLRSPLFLQVWFFIIKLID